MPFTTPPSAIDAFPDWLANYLSPQNGRPAYRMHQFTINGVTYPFVRDLHFAATPDPINRRHSMYAGLFLTRPGDLIVFFQSDPQWTRDDINSRRGLRGIYRIISEPFRDTSEIEHPRTHYRILGSCPNCRTPHSNLAKKCIKCEEQLPVFDIPSDTQDPYFFLLLSCRLDIEPLVIFERAISDERAYADMSEDIMLWIGRHDNQMGKGKGSSIRQLLPEESVKISRMMINEPGQIITRNIEKVNYPHRKLPLTNEDGTPASFLEAERRPRAGDKLQLELSLNYHLARTIDKPDSSIVRALRPHLHLNELEYISSEFPWGYTAGTSDFIFSLRNESGRYKLFIMELKKDKIDDIALIQVSIYVQWVVQVMTQYATPRLRDISVIPIVIGCGLKEGTYRPNSYSYNTRFNSGVEILVHVEKPLYLKYSLVETHQIEAHYYANDIEYLNESDNLPILNWVPPKGVVTSQVEKEWLFNTTWTNAKREASR